MAPMAQLRQQKQKLFNFTNRDDDDLSSVASVASLASLASTDLNTFQVDKLMAKEIDQLTLQDRNAIYEEIHGVSTMAIEETPQLLQDSLMNLQIELDKISGRSRLAYDRIANGEPDNRNNNNNNRSILHDRAFRLRFLRCEFFDAARAANRMMRFCDDLMVLYGEEAIGKFDGTMDFFVGKHHEQIAFRSGYVQLLPFRDRSGRKILIMVLDALELDSAIRLKIFLYMTFVGGEDVETQRNGIVMLFWPGCKETRAPNSAHRALVGRFLRSMPTRIVCFHFCFPKTAFFEMIRVVLSISLKQGKGITRVKLHTGERMELQYQLMGFGIPVSLIPTTGTGTLKTKVFAQWAKARKLLESLRKMEGDDATVAPRIECPGVRDVIFRSVGKSCMLNPGNVTFRGIFEEYHAEHVQAGQTEKKNLVWKIVEEIETRKGRFLVWDKQGWWVVLEDRAEIRNKVAISLRGYNKQRKAEENRQHFKSSTHAFERQDGTSKRRKRAAPCEQCGEDSDDSLHSWGGCMT